ncbi:FAR1-related sequence 5 [Prunus dulcis]|uniref:FAR1-related sequence 5 n=1 Tax=Prunus dulcis TaxID=3755 RepID=A0A4Y1QXN4_PRUDU|nr:FAR1-related sequence 5 [Prunus dulcis]
MPLFLVLSVHLTLPHEFRDAWTVSARICGSANLVSRDLPGFAARLTWCPKTCQDLRLELTLCHRDLPADQAECGPLNPASSRSAQESTTGPLLAPAHPRNVGFVVKGESAEFSQESKEVLNAVVTGRVKSCGKRNYGCLEKDIYYNERNLRNGLKGHDVDMLYGNFQLEHERNSSFTLRLRVDEEDRITHCFWADTKSRNAYTFFGDVLYLIVIDMLVEQFKKAMPGGSRKIYIDQDPAMTKAIHCSWHILDKFSERLGGVKYRDYFEDSRKCIWESESTEKFDSKWMKIVEKSESQDND